MKAIAGASPKARASFASGRCVRGTYIPSDRADEVTKSRSFTRPSRVLARFSVDGAPRGPEANLMLRGFSFRLGDAEHCSDILTQSAPVHYARTLDQTLAYLAARMPAPDGRPHPEKLKAFSTANPESSHQARYVAAHPLPASFADTTYWAVHAFPATNRSDETQFIKFKVVPVGNQAAPTEDAKTKPGDFLHDDLESRIAARDIRFSLMAVLGRPGDPILDVTIRWPDEDRRDTVRLGTIVITAIEARDAYVFDPAALAEGIGYPPDEIFAVRRAAYQISRARRR
ncbi:catalase [Bradyrhizobium sp. SSUT18]|uniref:catalase n=1 Tax=Bradyrhizobium sp. SSUT18 TaxID=3040602 RepID=UPI003267639E